MLKSVHSMVISIVKLCKAGQKLVKVTEITLKTSVSLLTKQEIVNILYREEWFRFQNGMWNSVMAIKKDFLMKKVFQDNIRSERDQIFCLLMEY